jgi:hypothetical protein
VPVLLVGVRDEFSGRPWLPPARHWPDRPNAVAGLDRLAGGSWLGLNDEGVVAGILNRMNTLGPAPGKRSRGELVLEALDHATAQDAAAALGDLDPGAYRPFNMFVADAAGAFWLRNPAGAGLVAAMPLPPGVSMITAHDRNDLTSRRIARYLPLFQAAAPPEPGDANRSEPSAGEGDWTAWEQLVASREHAEGGEATDGLEIVTDFGFDTTSSSLIALPALGRARRKAIWRFAAGRPSEVPFQPIDL